MIEVFNSQETEKVFHFLGGKYGTAAYSFKIRDRPQPGKEWKCGRKHKVLA